MNDESETPLPWDEIVDSIEQFYAGLDHEGIDELARAIELQAAANGRVRRAALDYFRQILTDCPGRDYQPGIHGASALMHALAAMVLEVSEDERHRFVEDVLFDVAPEVGYDGLGDVVRLLVPLDDLVALIVDRLDGGSDRQQANALAMQYALFGRSTDQKLGDERRTRIAAAVDRLVRRGSFGPLTAAEIAGFSLPEDAAD